jgi:ribosomal protein S18 acetylase RimI-like enzyme
MSHDHTTTTVRSTDQGAEPPPGSLDTDGVEVRTMRDGDLEAIVRIDERIGGRSRRKYFEARMAAALRESGIRISLVAEVDGGIAGFLMGSVFYGEFGRPEPSAAIDTIGVHPDFRGRRVGKALLRQLEMNMKALGIESLETQVDWNQWELLHFLEAAGFEPAPRICLRRNIA